LWNCCNNTVLVKIRGLLKVTLTFDNGPEPQVTPCVLDCLARHNVKSTFFVMGRKVIEPANARIARRASEEGHLIGNHTFSHNTPLGELDGEAALADFEQAANALKWLTQPDALFRPYGRQGVIGPHLLHPAVVEKLQAGGYTCVLWNCVPGDWHDPDAWVERALADCRSRPWSLVVLHDLPSGAMAHLDRFIGSLIDEGVELTQEFSPDCLPIVRGKVALPLEPYVQSGMRK
jgi:peptidoglycan/xylan/chitin deacetylase (PgdA/CDA1 family)